MATPAATIVILTYNRLHLSRWAVASALLQTIEDVEVVVVNNGSTDGTGQWLASLDDKRLRIVTLDENIYPAQARNIGLSAATGCWIAPLDDDDVLAPDCVQARIDAAAAVGADWAYAGCVFIDEDGQILGGRPASSPQHIVRRSPVVHSLSGGLSVLQWRAGALGQDPRLDQRLTYPVDWDTVNRLLRTGEPAYADRPLVAYRQHTTSYSSLADGLRHQFDIVETKHADLRDTRPMVRHSHDRYMGQEALHAGQRFDAARHFLSAVRGGDVGSVPRLLGTALPMQLQRLIRRNFLSDRNWLVDAQAWLHALAREIDTSHFGIHEVDRPSQK